jgi:ribosomal protein S18 acetylase RimI-like enzyme
MAVGPAGIHEGLDLDWLTAEAARDPFSHAYALWDAIHAPESTRFVRWDGPDGRRSYLLLWYGHPSSPVAHWVGRDAGDVDLVRSIPDAASVAIVPERVASLVLRRRRGSLAEPLLALVWAGNRPPSPPRGVDVRRLDPDDRPEVADFVRRFPDRLTQPYEALDLAREVAWGAYEGARLVGLARAPVRLEALWVIGGIFVSPMVRRRGHGRALTLAAMAAAVTSGARPGLYVRESNTAARQLYEALGFHRVDRRIWIDLATGPSATPRRPSAPSRRTGSAPLAGRSAG